MGSVLTAPIINQPQVAIVSTDAIVRRPVVVDLADGGEGIAIHPVGNLAMSWDHRASPRRLRRRLRHRGQDHPGRPATGAPSSDHRAATSVDLAGPLRVRWLGRVPYDEALALQRGLFEHGREQHLLLLEHPPVYTLGVRASTDNVLADPADVGAELVRTDRGGDVTYHGPGQLVGYPVLSLPP